MDDWKNSRCFRIDKNMIGEKMENLISVIVPVYNVEPYLKECISSILHQTHNALQVILIDDGSTDGSGEICDQFAKRDDRIEVIHQKNAGVSVARNAGLQRAIGKFVIFTDSDDKLPATAYQDLLEAWTGEDSLVIGRMQYINEEGEKLKLSPEFEISKIDTNTFTRELLEEKKFSYKNLSMEEIIHHLAFFVSRLWQIHVFGEGNTRTTAVFFIKYLRTLGFDATNDIFAENAWYFRNALVRANYNDLKNGVHETTEYLELFLRNLLLDEKNELHNRTMHISGKFAEVDIESGEVDIESTKVDIRNKLLSFSDTISEKTINHTVEIFSKCGKENCFGRTIVEEITGLKPSGASKLIKLLVDSEVIVPVTGHGKGKYRFQ